jgi:lactate dehydrogenase-like 2-hydroxyacid dehydrogenase
VNHQGDALRLGMNWTEEDLAKPQVLVDSAYGMGHPGTFHFRELIELENVIITPHAAYYSEEAIRTVRDFAAQEVVRVLTGKPPLSPVNAAQLANANPTRSA